MASGNDPSVSQHDTFAHGDNSPIVRSDQYIGGQGVHMTNPGSVDPADVNPYANKFLQNNADLYDQFSKSAAGSAFNPNFYDQLQANQENHLTTALGNQYAARGLSGSSAEMGGMSSAIQNNQMAWLNRRQGDQMLALRGLEGLNQMGYSELMGIQNQYGNFEEAIAQNAMGMEGMKQQREMADNQMWAQIIGGGMGAGGMAAGGAGGGGAAGAAAAA